MPRTDLRELLGARYDRTLGNAYAAFRSRLIFNTAPNAIVADALDRALAAVLPDLLADARREGQADAWDEGHEAGWDDLAACEAEPDLTDTPNPYRTEETDHA